MRLAYRNLWRNHRRTLITVASVAGGMMFSLLFTGLQDGGYSKLIDSSARIGSGHLTFEHRAYRDDPDLKHSIVDYHALPKLFAGHKEILGYAARLSSQGMLSSARGAVGVYFDAVEPARERPISPIVGKIVAGVYLDEAIPNGILLGEVLARKLKVEIGSKVVLTVNNRDNRTMQELLQVVGIFRVGADAMDGFYFQVPLAKAQEVLGFARAEVLQLAVFLQSGRETERLLRQLSSTGLPAEVVLLTWKEVMRDLANYIAMDEAFNYILQFVAFLIIAAGILNTVLMSVMERRFELGVMLALGTSPARLFALVLLETGCIGILGLIFGSAAGWGLNLLFSRHPIDLSRFIHDELHISGYAMEPVLRTGLYFDHYLTTCGLVYLLVLLVGIYPALKAARVVPVQALAAKL
jgi:ABC-type lipoprotein release transport system permease subunit